MIAFAVQLVLAHTVGDFLLQPNKWVKDKRKRKHKSPYLYAHIAVHTIALLVILQFQYLLAIGIIAVSHYCIDLIKLHLTNKKNERKLFVVDQIAHVAVLASVLYFYFPFQIEMDPIFTPQVHLFVLFVLVVSVVAAIVMKYLMWRWNKEIDTEQVSLENAGLYIGMLERLFVFGFVITGNMAAIGFLIAAKSVFRFGDLSKAKNRKLTEYVLVGTLLSFGIAIVAGWAYTFFQGQL